MFSVSKGAYLAPYEVEEKLSVGVVRAIEVVGTDVKVLESIHLPSHCQEAKPLQSIRIVHLCPFPNSLGFYEQYRFTQLMASTLSCQ